ncbi:MAG: acyltransferase [Spirochaetes bacterium]|nr:acyltransferase [Spirochaetota bacterium]
MKSENQRIRESENQRIRESEIDVLRAFSVFAVIVIHISAYFTKIQNINLLQMTMAFIDGLALFAVPSFIFISGLVLYRNYGSNIKLTFDRKNISKFVSVKQFYLKRFRRIVPIYLMFSLFYYLFSEKHHIIKNLQIDFNFVSILFKLMTGGAFYHLWYFGILFQFYLLFPIVSKIYLKYKINLLIFSFAFQLLWNFIGSNFIQYIGKSIGYDNLSFPVMFDYIFWFILGFYFFENKDKIIGYVKLKKAVFND